MSYLSVYVQTIAIDVFTIVSRMGESGYIPSVYCNLAANIVCDSTIPLHLYTFGGQKTIKLNNFH